MGLWVVQLTLMVNPKLLAALPDSERAETPRLYTLNVSVPKGMRLFSTDADGTAAVARFNPTPCAVRGRSHALGLSPHLALAPALFGGNPTAVASRRKLRVHGWRGDADRNNDADCR